MKKMHTNKQWL